MLALSCHKNFALVRLSVIAIAPVFVLLFAICLGHIGEGAPLSGQYQNENRIADDRGNAARTVPYVGSRGEGVLLPPPIQRCDYVQCRFQNATRDCSAG